MPLLDYSLQRPTIRTGAALPSTCRPIRASSRLDGTRLPSLDGWRALSIILVLGAHSMVTVGFPSTWKPAFTWAFDGDLGVRCFFLISGFLITWLLLREHQMTGRINLNDFYIRRAIRILLVYWAFLAAVALLSVFTAFHQSLLAWFANLTFTTDYVYPSWTTAHLWSLAVEEQFYLIWPVTLGIILRWNRARSIGLGLVVSVMAGAALSRVVGFETHHAVSRHPLLSVFSFFNYFDTIAAGCAAAALMTYRPQTIERLRERSGLWAAVGLLLVAVPYALGKSLPEGTMLVAFAPTLQGMGMAVLVLQSILIPRRGLYKFFNLPLVQRIGVLSYSLYIWQMIFCTPPRSYGVGPVWWLSFPTWLIPVFAVATLSFYGFERPLLRLRARFRHVPLQPSAEEVNGDR